MTLRISKQDLIAVPLAARMLYQRAYGALPPEPHLAERLNGLAYRLARIGAVYAIEPGKDAPRRLSRREIACGHFRHGGKELHFLDERAPIVDIGVTRQCLEKALTAFFTPR
jgi:hypothetical protein